MEWCIYTTLLEPFSSLNCLCDPIPTPVPTAGIPCGVTPSFVHNGFVVVWLLFSIPDFGRFIGSHGAVVVDAVLAKNLPRRSRENEFTDGRVYEFKRVKDIICPLEGRRV